MHWVAENDSVLFESRVYSRLFSVPFPGKATGNLIDDINPESLVVYKGSRMPLEMSKMLKDTPRW